MSGLSGRASAPRSGARLLALACLLGSLLEPTMASALEGSALPAPYPQTKRLDLVEDHFGSKVADPYRWLENDARTDPQVAAWVAAQNALSDAYLKSLPGPAIFKARMQQTYNHERTSLPKKGGARLFYVRNSGLQKQSVLYVRETAAGEERVLMDPNGWSADGATALAEWSPTHDGGKLAYGVQDGGSDWRTIQVLDVDSGQVLPDKISWARFSSIEWAKDGSGFFYARYPEPSAFQTAVAGHAIYFHRLGDAQSQDRLVHSTPDQPNLVHYFSLSEDGRFLIVNSDMGSMKPKLGVVDLNRPQWRLRKLAGEFDHNWTVAGNVGTRFYLVTSDGAERFRLVTMDISADKPVVSDLVPEQAAVLREAKLVGNRLLLTYLVDVKSEVRRYTLDGAADGVVALPGAGTTAGFNGGPDSTETFYEYTSFNSPNTIYRYDVASNTSSVWAKPKVAVDLDNISVEQVFATSRDGTRIPIFVARRKDVQGPAPTIMLAYGGFSLSFLPAFSPARMAWVEQGGVFAIAHIRGGDEYGAAWHRAGRRQLKQNVFNDFIAAGEHLKATGVTSSKGLAIQGGSNGGLLIGTVLNQRPELFDAALPMVGVMDMLRFDQFTIGKFWADEYGSPGVEADFRNLRAYSPYHNIQSGKTYPPILATTADTDDRVVPAHTFKYVAALQAADIGPAPHIVRIETRAGHSAGKPVDKAIEEYAALWGFAAEWTGLKLAPLQ